MTSAKRAKRLRATKRRQVTPHASGRLDQQKLAEMAAIMGVSLEEVRQYAQELEDHGYLQRNGETGVPPYDRPFLPET